MCPLQVTPPVHDDFEQGYDAGTFVQTALADKTLLVSPPPSLPPVSSHMRAAFPSFLIVSFLYPWAWEKDLQIVLWQILDRVLNDQEYTCSPCHAWGKHFEGHWHWRGKLYVNFLNMNQHQERENITPYCSYILTISHVLIQLYNLVIS